MVCDGLPPIVNGCETANREVKHANLRSQAITSGLRWHRCRSNHIMKHGRCCSVYGWIFQCLCACMWLCMCLLFAPWKLQGVSQENWVRLLVIGAHKFIEFLCVSVQQALIETLTKTWCAAQIDLCHGWLVVFHAMACTLYSATTTASLINRIMCIYSYYVIIILVLGQFGCTRILHPLG